ncbi:Gti1/Pac2 family transcription factor [Nematocida parisii]|uniref:Gti1/Pac2 family protein n=1 Tax=Nematocida parisii (strain ERTm3) TaxID=935791 RepID=I3EHN4_NEMP3|nr:uncharacterized protein NEPG_00512 [Nematocida parisii ERTm1]EIJ88731.1 hypothetical protein NEQG_01421 [Nematocida parisii ERTm3]KAI5127020.1 Gti1/Pac2 family transcription factor [Nematocida parisii]EIJ94987.1 hypothetical protein NEPG_00512 [Nematocida parisii ERTm1]KAI5128336.1 Gti1/Pac2 family transcription factor [Nematocida parisii]KAI5140795.1 Gti1/Pac2 family transcription factor [Nematocida parisii]|eukprot:XP_013058343.1 hypothetical protein NEPG_00512 [Nematocida parisii ERTm1]
MNRVIKGRISTLTIRRNPQSPETIFGAIMNEEECIKIIDMSRVGALPMIKCRLSDAERDSIRPGSIYVYEEEESGISRWTDGKIWSTSKINGRCLLYYELMESSYDLRLEDLSSMHGLENILTLGKEIVSVRKGEKRIPKKNGLIKMTTSLVYQNKTYHMLSYFTEKFIKEYKRAPIWNQVVTWQIPRNLVLRMNYRRKRSYASIDKKDSQIQPIKIKERDETRARSLPETRTFQMEDVLEISEEFLDNCYLKKNEFFSF